MKRNTDTYTYTVYFLWFGGAVHMCVYMSSLKVLVIATIWPSGWANRHIKAIEVSVCGGA